MCELFEQVRAGSMALPTIGDDERDLCFVSARQAVEAADRDDVGAVERHERFTVVMVDVREALDLSRHQVRVQDEEPQPRGLVRQPFVEVHECIAI